MVGGALFIDPAPLNNSAIANETPLLNIGKYIARTMYT